MIHDLHEALGWVFVGANAAVGMWALAAHLWPRFRHRAGWIAVGVAQAVILGQVFIGTFLSVRDDAANDRHQLYGFAAFASVALIFAYRNEMRDKPYLLYGLGSLWLMGLGIRSITLV